jgi:hypothetical protein
MLVLLLGITPPGINNSVEYAAYREADTALWYDSGNSQKSGRFQPERVAALNRITRQVYSGMGGSFAPDFPPALHLKKLYNRLSINDQKKISSFIEASKNDEINEFVNLSLQVIQDEIIKNDLSKHSQIKWEFMYHIEKKYKGNRSITSTSS